MSVVARAVVGTALLLSGLYTEATWQWIGIPLGLILIASASVKRDEERKELEWEKWGKAQAERAEVERFHQRVCNYIFQAEVDANQGFVHERPTPKESESAYRKGLTAREYAIQFRDESWAEHRAWVKEMREEGKPSINDYD